jgi:glutamate-1-semialdehyde 2,1-aminomutase
LEALGDAFEAGVRGVLRTVGVDFQFPRIGSMFCLYFTEAPVRNLDDAKKSDRAAFARFFHGCREAGVYFAPSQFEAGFLCVAHTEADFARTAEVALTSLKRALASL